MHCSRRCNICVIAVNKTGEWTDNEQWDERMTIIVSCPTGHYSDGNSDVYSFRSELLLIANKSSRTTFSLRRKIAPYVFIDNTPVPSSVRFKYARGRYLTDNWRGLLVRKPERPSSTNQQTSGKHAELIIYKSFIKPMWMYWTLGCRQNIKYQSNSKSSI